MQEGCASNIWEDNKVEKFVDDKDSKQKWRCLHCLYLGIGWNTTKATAHVAKVRGHDIAICKAAHDAKHAARYKTLQDATEKKRKKSSIAHDQIYTSITSQQDQMSLAVENRLTIAVDNLGLY